MTNGLIREMEDLLFEKIERINKCLSFYETLDDSIKVELCDVIFRSIDEELSEIKRLDLDFVLKLDKFKAEHSILDLNELDYAIKSDFAMIQKAVDKILSLKEKLNEYYDNTNLLRIKVKEKSQENMKKSRITSAYRNINKI
ncbi:hypothetical protein [Fusibacter bizertensis]